MSKVVKTSIVGKTKRLAKTEELNTLIGSKPEVVWFELITNIPPEAVNIVWKIDVVKSGAWVTYEQDVCGPTISELEEDTINEDTVKDGKLNLKDKDGSSIFGSGLGTVGKYCGDLDMSWEDVDGNPYNYDHQAEEDFITIGEPMPNHKFQVKGFVKGTSRMGGYKNWIDKLRTQIAEYDAEPILVGRTHTILVSGMNQAADNSELSKPIEPWSPTWINENGTLRTSSEFNSLPDGSGGMSNQVVVESPGADDGPGEKSSIVLNIDGVGKIDGENKLSKWIGDKPMIRLKYNGSDGQMANLLPLRTGNGMLSLNNKFIDVWVDSKEVATYMVKTDKYEGLSASFQTDVLETIQPLLLQLYPDVSQVEKGGQLFQYDIIVKNQMGTGTSNEWRTKHGLGPMNDMTEDEKRAITKKEISKDNGRYDIVVYMIWKSGGVLGKKTPKWLCEMKKKDFGRNDRNQLYAYALKDRRVEYIIGISHNITQSALDSYAQDRLFIMTSERLKGVKIYKELIDISDLGFDAPPTYRYYLDKVRALQSK